MSSVCVSSHSKRSHIEELEAEGANRKATDIMRLWALTGCRRDEIAALRWTEIDVERGSLRLEESKTGASVRPLAAAAVALLATIDRDPEKRTGRESIVLAFAA